MNKTLKPQPARARTSLDSDSLSFLIPWQKNRAPPIYPNAQTGRTVTAPEFWLFYVAVILLILSLGLGALSIWSLIFKSSFTPLVDPSPELAYFTIPVAIFCLPCFWIVLSVHNDEKSYNFLRLALGLMTFAIGVTVVGVYMGFSHRLHLKRSQMGRSAIFEEFRGSLRKSMVMAKDEGTWSEIQEKLGCCGVDNYTDWLIVLQRIPKSCCSRKAMNCRDNSTSSPGCLKLITANLALQTCLFSGIICVALFLQCCAFLVVTGIYFCGKRHLEE